MFVGLMTRHNQSFMMVVGCSMNCLSFCYDNAVMLAVINLPFPFTFRFGKPIVDEAISLCYE